MTMLGKKEENTVQPITASTKEEIPQEEKGDDLPF